MFGKRQNPRRFFITSSLAIASVGALAAASMPVAADAPAAAKEELEQLAKLVKTFPAKGKRPEKFLIFGLLENPAGNWPAEIASRSREIALALGSNTLPEVKPPHQNGRVGLSHVPTKELAEYCRKLKQEEKAERIKVVTVGSSFDSFVSPKSPDDSAAFHTFLKTKNLSPADVGLKSLDDAKVELNDKQSLLYYHSHLFRIEHALAAIKERTDIVQANLSTEVLTAARSSAESWPKEWQIVRPYKRRALTLPTSVDGLLPTEETSLQMAGCLMAALRSGAQQQSLPIMWSCPPGLTADNLRRAYYTAIAQGVKLIEFQGMVLSVPAKNPIAGDQWKTIHDLVHETGQFENVVFRGRIRPPQVGLLMSFAQDLWNDGSAYEHERQCLYLALRHAGYSVDFVTEEDIQEGLHRGLKVIYVVGNHLETATANELKRWVQDGGVLAAFAGGGFWNEFNRPMDVLNEVYGIKEQKIDRRNLSFSTRDLARLKPLDTIGWLRPKEEFPAIGFKQTMKPAEKAEILATFADGSPAVVENKHGQGTAYLFGSLLASAYVRDAFLDEKKMREKNFLPTEFNGQLTDVITLPCATAEIPYDYTIDQPLVEVTILESPEGLAITLVNWSGQPQDVKLSIDRVQPIYTKATSIQRGPIAGLGLARSISFKIRVDVADMILLER